MEKIRSFSQMLWLFLVNGNWSFPITKNIYQGPLKIICSPGLNCYSCPASTTYCPIGSLQQLFLSIRFSIQSGHFYIGTFVLGSMGILGAFCGRFICGWVCPFGFFQELLYKIHSPKFSIPSWLRWFKYLVLLLLVVVLPLTVVDQFGLGRPWFCKYLCPAGTLEAGIPMVLLQPDLRATIGLLYWNKIVILLFYIIWSIVSSRAFCRTTCPLGAFYAMFSKFQLVKLKLNKQICTNCKACHSVCPVEIKFNETPTSPECVNCLKCMTEACNYGAIEVDIAGYSLTPMGKHSIKTTSNTR